MKTSAVVYVGALRSAATTVLAAAFLCVDAWAGGGPPTAAPARGDEYRLVFPAGYEVPAKPEGAGRDENRRPKFEAFVGRLNEAGAEGYRLVSFVYDGSGVPVGLFKRAGKSYEYKWLHTDGSVGGSQVTAGFDREYPALSQQGFRLAGYSVFEDYCVYYPTEQPGPYPTECHDAYVFLFEREKGAAHPARHAVAKYPGSDAGFLTEVNRLLADGLAPTHSLTTYRIWFEPAAADDARWGGGAEIEVVSEAKDAGTWRRSTFRKRIDELARRGYRVAMLNWGTALMYRARGGEAARYSYEWAKADGGLERRLSQLQARGAVYVKTYQKHQRADHLVFERGATSGGARYEYKTLTFKFGKAVDASGARVRFELAPPAKEALRAFERYVGEGFAVRDLFLWDGRVAAILERPR